VDECIVVKIPLESGCLRIVVSEGGKSVWYEFPLEHSIVVTLPGHTVSVES
jgi:hypothetical protein